MVLCVCTRQLDAAQYLLSISTLISYTYCCHCCCHRSCRSVYVCMRVRLTATRYLLYIPLLSHIPTAVICRSGYVCVCARQLDAARYLLSISTLISYTYCCHCCCHRSCRSSYVCMRQLYRCALPTFPFQSQLIYRLLLLLLPRSCRSVYVCMRASSFAARYVLPNSNCNSYSYCCYCYCHRSCRSGYVCARVSSTLRATYFPFPHSSHIPTAAIAAAIAAAAVVMCACASSTAVRYLLSPFNLNSYTDCCYCYCLVVAAVSMCVCAPG